MGELKEANQKATEQQVGLFRLWVNCPEDYSKTPPELASQAYLKLCRYPIYPEAHELLSYMRGAMPIPLRHFHAMQEIYMCESSADREAVRRKLHLLSTRGIS